MVAVADPIERALAAHERRDRLERIRHSTLFDDRHTGWEWRCAEFGLDECPTPAVRGAWIKGWNAAVAGASFYRDDPYRQRDRSDRRGRWNEGFRALYRRAWELGYAWAEHLKASDDFETHSLVMALGNRTWDDRRLVSKLQVTPKPRS